MASVTEALTNTTVRLDDRSKEKVAKINGIIEGAGKMPLLLSIAHFFGWIEKDISSPLKIATEDWTGFARAINGIAVIQLGAIHDIAHMESMRFTLNDGGGQREFWENVRDAAYAGMMKRSK